MKKVFPSATLLWCLNKESVPFIVLGHEESCEVYTTKMELLAKVELPFKPLSYAIVSENGLLIFDYGNQVGMIDVQKGTFIEMKAPSGTSNTKRLSASCLLKVDNGFVFLTPNSAARKTSYHYSPSTNKFTKVKIELPEFYSSVDVAEQGAYCVMDECGNVQFCSFETAYREKRFISEMSLDKVIIPNHRDIHEVCCDIAYLSIEKKTVILAAPDRADASACVEHIKNRLLGKEDSLADYVSLVKLPNSGKLVLIKDNEQVMEIKVGYRPYLKCFNTCSESIVFAGCLGRIEAYSTDDLTLLASLPITLGPKTIFLPDGRMVHEVDGDVYVADSSPLAIALKANESRGKH